MLRSRVILVSAALLATAFGVPQLAVAAPAAAQPAASTAKGAPQVIPALTNWTAADGAVTLGPGTAIVTDGSGSGLQATAQTLAGDLRAERSWPVPVRPAAAPRPGDIVLSLDPARTDLGGEGYALRIGDGVVRITGRTATGVFYGTRTVLQMLATSDTIGDGSTTDVPAYAERAIGVCACYTYDTDAWLGRLIKDMAYLKLNTLHLELKVKSTQYPQINTFSYYTPEEIQQLAALAARYHVTLIPEINSPGHMDPYIENLPQYQLIGSNGAADPTRLDITNPAALSFYESLIDADLKLFGGKYFHMGADEYMIGSAYSNYPQLLKFAQEKYGPGATAEDAYVWFVNQVDDYVRSKGRVLRIWNDGLNGGATVPVNKDVIVEYWLPEPVTSQNLLDQGYTVLNSSDALYYVRGGYAPDVKGLYDSGWNPDVFPGQTVAAGQAGVAGAEMMVWPDNYGHETENTTQANLFLPLRFLAQATWDGGETTMSYPTFTALADQLGRAPGWGPQWIQPVPGGTYTIRDTATGGVLGTSGSASGATLTATTSGTDTWKLAPTSDGYYQMVSTATGLCAQIASGTPNRLGVIEQAGAPVSAQTCDTTAQTQKWQLEPAAGGYRIVNAITQEAASAPDTAVVQQPRDVATADTWQIRAG